MLLDEKLKSMDLETLIEELDAQEWDLYKHDCTLKADAFIGNIMVLNNNKIVNIFFITKPPSFVVIYLNHFLVLCQVKVPFFLAFLL